MKKVTYDSFTPACDTSDHSMMLCITQHGYTEFIIAYQI